MAPSLSKVDELSLSTLLPGLVFPVNLIGMQALPANFDISTMGQAKLALLFIRRTTVMTRVINLKASACKRVYQ